MAQISLSGKSSMFDTKHTANKYSTFTIWNLKEDGVGEKKWFPVGMGTSSGIAMETYTSPNGESITPVLHISRPVVRVAVNEYPPFVYKVTTVDEEGCLNHLVPCYARINTSNTLQEKMFCCFGASLDFLAFLQKDLNFEAYVYFSPDGQYGTQKDSTGQWNGIVGELVDGRAMLSLEMGLNKRRAHVISFAQPTLPLELGILVNKSDMRKGTSNCLVPKNYHATFLQHMAPCCNSDQVNAACCAPQCYTMLRLFDRVVTKMLFFSCNFENLL